ncbi:MAG TPA: Ig-like domain-containing protein, partial [Thermoanaerobaculia bacterium]|nr:Ig-like domain-containing protein [Thermoanaerobaculia bacterium]
MARRDLRCHGVPGGWVDTPLHNGPVEGGQCAGGAPPTIDVQTAYELATRLFYLGAGPVGRWFECRTDGTAGCIADGGYLNQLAADDDNGNLTDGTPHMKAIHAAYDRRDIDCAAFPVVQNSGCGGAPTAAPIVTATPLDRAVRLTWSTVPNALSYDVFRTEGVFQCDFGKTRIGQVQAGDCAGGNCEFLAEELQNDFEYYFTVLPLGGSNGPANTCTGVMSACTTATPVSGSNLSVNESSAALTMLSGDGDIFLDNCENARVEFPVFNIGSATQTNVRIVGVEPTSHPGMTVTTSFPAPVAATLASCATASGSFDFTAFGAAFQDDVEFVVELTSDQLAAQGVTRKFTLRFPGIAEGDFQPQASKVFDFESNLESWQVVLGTFNRTTANPPGGAGGSAAFVASSSNLPSQCDQIRSPLVRLTATSTLSLSNQFETEGDGGTGTWYDRANVGIVDYSSGDRTVVSPDGGRAYNVPNGAANGTCDTQGQPGWAGTHAGFGTAAGWAASNFSATALGSAAIAGDVVRIGINYGTDSGTHLRGFWFDRAQLTNFELHVPDAQSCGVNLAPDAVDDAASTLRNTPVAVAVLANDSDPEGDTLAITAVQSPTAQGGTATVNANGTPGNTGDDFIDYSPPSGFLSPPDDTFTYSIGDGHGHFDTATVRITVSSRNNPPDAVDDSASTPQNTPVAIDVLANDTDPDGDALAITSVQSPTARGGTAAIDDNGTASNTADDFIRYTPPAGFFSPPPDSFIYTISDGRDSANATVTVTVEAPCPPQPTGSFSDNIETVVAGYQTQSTRTDPPPSSWRRFSPDSSASSASTVWQALDDQPGNPTLTPIDHRLVLPPLDLSATSQLSFKHNFDFARFPAATLATSFQSGSAIEISADGGTNWVDIGNFITTGGYNGVVDADASANTNPLRGRPAWVGTSNPATPGDPRIGPNGRLEAMTANPVQVNLGAAIQTLFSTPHLLNALIRFRLGGTFQALGGGIQGTGWGIDDVAVTGLLEEANCPPVAEDDSASTPRNTPVTVNVVTNDSDPNGDPLTVTSVTDPPHGSAVNNGNGTVTYTPDSGFVGNDSFGYTVCDDGTPPLCDTATVAVTVTAPLLPDLVVSNITVNNNRNVREGDKVTIRATVSNTGNASAQASTTEFRLDNTTILGSVATPSIPAGGSQQVSVQWDTRSQKGPHTIRVTADAGQTVTESSETNNSSTLNITVQGNKVKNASFEQGGGSSQGASSMSASVPGPAAWSGSSTGAGSTTWSDGGSDGAKSAGATGNGGNAATSGSPSWTSDAIVVTPGEALSFLVSVSSANASSAPTAGLVYLGAAGNVLQTVNLITAPLTTAGFAKLEQPVTIPPGVAQVRVKLVGFAPTDLRTSGTVRFDEVGLFGD